MNGSAARRPICRIPLVSPAAVAAAPRVVTAAVEAPGGTRLRDKRWLAEKLGISPRMVDKLIAKGKIGPNVVKLGRAARFNEREIEEWIGAGCPARDAWAARQATAGGGK